MSALMDRISRELIQPVQYWFSQRPPQEQKILIFGLPVIVLLVLYILLVQPLAQSYLARKAALETANSDLVWIRDQREILERLNTACDPRSLVYSQDSFEADIEAAARRFSLVPNLRQQGGGDSYQLILNNAQGNRVLSLVRILSCSGASVVSLDVQNAETDSLEINAVLTIVYGGAN